MTENHLTPEDLALFQRDTFTFKQLKEQLSEAELTALKGQYKTVWQKWKDLQLSVSAELPKELDFTKPKIESWTNGWNLRNHFWSAYRSHQGAEKSPCIGVLANRRQLQIYLMFQHYHSDKRGDDPQKYNQLLARLPQWAADKDISDYYIWPQPENELADHLPLSTYLADPIKQQALADAIGDRSFQLGRLLYRDQTPGDYPAVIQQTIKELYPLYQSVV